MSFFSLLRTQILSWSQGTPLPADLPDAIPTFQSWHEFKHSADSWQDVKPTQNPIAGSNQEAKRSPQDPKFNFVTWNVDATSALPEARISAILSHITNLSPAIDIIFLQEVSRAALMFLLKDPRIRESWFVSESDETNRKGQSFASMTLLSRSRFGYAADAFEKPKLGPVWRVKYPTCFGRDALCCDVFIHSSCSGSSTQQPTETRVRLVNVHLDSLPIQPSHRPRQVAIIASILRSAGHGLVAGDFNPVLPEDENLIQDNNLVDVWPELNDQDPGFTWGIDGMQPFPPNRLDKIAMLGLRAHDIKVIHPGVVTLPGSKESSRDGTDQPSQSEQMDNQLSLDKVGDVPWTDHSGLMCSFSLTGQ